MNIDMSKRTEYIYIYVYITCIYIYSLAHTTKSQSLGGPPDKVHWSSEVCVLLPMCTQTPRSPSPNCRPPQSLTWEKQYLTALKRTPLYFAATELTMV